MLKNSNITRKNSHQSKDYCLSETLASNSSDKISSHMLTIFSRISCYVALKVMRCEEKLKSYDEAWMGWITLNRFNLRLFYDLKMSRLRQTAGAAITCC